MKNKTITPKEKVEKLFDEVNKMIPIDASFTDTVEVAKEKMKKDHLATKEICDYIITNEYNSKRDLIINLKKDGFISVLDRYELSSLLDKEEQEVKQEIEKL